MVFAYGMKVYVYWCTHLHCEDHWCTSTQSRLTLWLRPGKDRQGHNSDTSYISSRALINAVNCQKMWYFYTKWRSWMRFSVMLRFKFEWYRKMKSWQVNLFYQLCVCVFCTHCWLKKPKSRANNGITWRIGVGVDIVGQILTTLKVITKYKLDNSISSEWNLNCLDF